jgi:hypothetical protein
MHRWVLSVALFAFVAAPAAADGDLYWTVYKDKDIYVSEWITINKNIDIDVDVDVDADSVAEALALLNQNNEYNKACDNCAEKRDTIDGSVNDNSGIVSVNQAAGNNNNQGDAIAIAIDDTSGGGGDIPPDAEDSFADSQAHVEQNNRYNDIDAVNLAFRDALITGSINGNSGVIHVNQATGNNNNQGNALSVALGLQGTGVALAEADLAQDNYLNENYESDSQGHRDGDPIGINKTATITGSINDNSGVIGVNQTAGNMANQANVVSVAAATSVR